MEELFYLAIAVILVIVIVRVNAKLRGIGILLEKIDHLNKEVLELGKKISSIETARPAEIKAPESISPVKPKPFEEPKPKEEVFKAIDITGKLIEERLPAPTPEKAKKESIVIEAPILNRPVQEVYEPKESSFDKWIRNNPDIEKFIGENLVNKIGIAVLVLGIAFFVKYAIDQEWINEVGRVCIGLLAGGILIGFAHVMRNGYKALSSVLVGGGLCVFYFTIAFAFHQYSLFGQEAAFAIMVVITAFAVILSILYNRLEIAIIAAIGGFLTPFLVSTGKGNYVILFTYLAILNAGLIVLALYKKWRVLNFISFVFTMLIYGGWIVSNYDAATGFSYTGTFLFGTLFYLMFLSMNVIHHAGRGSKLNAFDLSILLAVNLSYYSSGMFLLKHAAPELTGVFTAALGIINLAMAYTFYKRNNIDKNFVYLLIGLTLSYISLAAPVQLNGNYITLFWSAEVVVLFWLFQKSRIVLVKIASAFVTTLMLVSLLMDWAQVYMGITLLASKSLLPVIINKGFITSIVAAVAMGITSRLFNAEADSFYLKGITNKLVRNFYTVITVALFYMAGMLEIMYQFSHRFANAGLEYVYLQLYTIGFFVLLFYIMAKVKISVSSTTRLAFSALLLLFYLVNIGNIYQTEKTLLTTGTYTSWFMAQWVSVVLILLFIYQTIQYIRSNKMNLQKLLTAFSWITVIAIIIVLSIEIRHLYIWISYSNPASVIYAENLFSKAGLSIIWGLSSFALIWLGMQHRFKPLRVIALVLFGITLIKLFAYDIRNIPPGGKIAAFILLGVLLLIVSFMYQRLKKLLIDDSSRS